MATFGVADIAPGPELLLPGEVAAGAFAWPNGRRAVLTASGRVFEVTAAGLVERFIALTPAASPYGDGDFIDEQLDGGVLYCVRGNLDGSVDRVPTPYGVSIGEHNERGDVVAFVPSTAAPPPNPGLWRLLRTDSSLALAGSLTLSSAIDVPSIESNATVTLAYPESGVVRLSRFVVGDLGGEHHGLTPYGGDVYLGNVHYDAGADGRGVLAFLVRQPATQSDFVQVARFAPGIGLRFLSVVVRRWPVVSGASASVEAVHVGDLGSACVAFTRAHSDKGTGGSTSEVVRVEQDDRLTAPWEFMTFTTNQGRSSISIAHRSPFRAEQWAVVVPYQATTMSLTRSRPDTNVGRQAYRLAAAPFALHFAFDDSGRAVVAYSDRVAWVPTPTTRVLVWN